VPEMQPEELGDHSWSEVSDGFGSTQAFCGRGGGARTTPRDHKVKWHECRAPSLWEL